MITEKIESVMNQINDPENQVGSEVWDILHLAMAELADAAELAQLLEEGRPLPCFDTIIHCLSQ